MKMTKIWLREITLKKVDFCKDLEWINEMASNFRIDFDVNIDQMAKWSAALIGKNRQKLNFFRFFQLTKKYRKLINKNKLLCIR